MARDVPLDHAKHTSVAWLSSSTARFTFADASLSVRWSHLSIYIVIPELCLSDAMLRKSILRWEWHCICRLEIQEHPVVISRSKMNVVSSLEHGSDDEMTRWSVHTRRPLGLHLHSISKPSADSLLPSEIPLMGNF